MGKHLQPRCLVSGMILTKERKKMRLLTSEKAKCYLLCVSAVALDFVAVAALFALARGLDLTNLTLV
jgi:hypothetical protein